MRYENFAFVRSSTAYRLTTKLLHFDLMFEMSFIFKLTGRLSGITRCQKLGCHKYSHDIYVFYSIIISQSSVAERNRSYKLHKEIKIFFKFIIFHFLLNSIHCDVELAHNMKFLLVFVVAISYVSFE